MVKSKIIVSHEIHTRYILIERMNIGEEEKQHLLAHISHVDLARRIQSNPTLVHSTSLTFDKVRPYEDLPRLSKASLQTWIRSRGYTMDTLTMEETLNHAYTV